MPTRRDLLYLSAMAAFPASKMTPRERVDRALRGEDVDRPPFTFWYHFLDEKLPGERHAKSTLEFHRKFRTDLVKVMSDYPYPKPAGRWYELKVEASPYPEQLQALELIRDGLGGSAHFVETIFNPWNVAEKLSSAEEVRRMQKEEPKRLLSALEVIAESEANHAKKAIAAGASGIFLAIANAQDGIMTKDEYDKFSAPFDKLILGAVPNAPLNTIHMHGDKAQFFYTNWPARVINYSAHGTRLRVGEFRKSYAGVIMGGIDEVNYRTLTPAQLTRQIDEARRAAGPKFILAPGCSVPNETTDAEMQRLPKVLGA
jgi:uroporphyrinogen decarboxylase